MAKVLRKPQAEADLIEIWTYIAQYSPTSADKLLDEFDEKSQTLAQSPFIGKARDELGPNIRSFPICFFINQLHGSDRFQASFNNIVY